MNDQAALTDKPTTLLALGPHLRPEILFRISVPRISGANNQVQDKPEEKRRRKVNLIDLWLRLLNRPDLVNLRC